MDHPVRRGSLGLLVGDQHHGHVVAGGQAREQIDEFAAAVGIDHRRRLVGDQQARPPGERRRDSEALLLPAGKRRGLPLRESVETDLLQQARDVHFGVGAQGGSAGGSGVGRQTPYDVVGNQHAERLRFGPLQHQCGAVELPEPG